jgi:hypothetical protein
LLGEASAGVKGNGRADRQGRERKINRKMETRIKRNDY